MDDGVTMSSFGPRITRINTKLFLIFFAAVVAAVAPLRESDLSLSGFPPARE
jgi:hypothetical protein